jgi:hypothetical protein
MYLLILFYQLGLVYGDYSEEKSKGRLLREALEEKRHQKDWSKSRLTLSNG